MIYKQYLTLYKNHNNLLKHKKRDIYEVGSVFYIVSNIAFDVYHKDSYRKIGIAKQKKRETLPCFTSRISTYNTCSPHNYKVHYLIYLEENSLLENIIKTKYKKQLDPTNKEWIKGERVEDIIEFIRKTCEMLDLEYRDIIFENELNNKEEPEDIDDESKDENDGESTNNSVYESDGESSDGESSEDETETETEEDDNMKRYKEILNKLDSEYEYKSPDLTRMLKELRCSIHGDKTKRLKEKLEEVVNNRKYCIGCDEYRKCDKFRKLLQNRLAQECIFCEQTEYPNIIINLNIVNNPSLVDNGKYFKCNVCNKSKPNTDFYYKYRKKYNKYYRNHACRKCM